MQVEERDLRVIKGAGVGTVLLQESASSVLKGGMHGISAEAFVLRDSSVGAPDAVSDILRVAHAVLLANKRHGINVLVADGEFKIGVEQEPLVPLWRVAAR